MKTYFYFAYGSNLNIDQMSERCSDPIGIALRLLPDIS